MAVEEARWRAAWARTGGSGGREGWRALARRLRRPELLEEEDDAEEAVDEDEDERDAAGVAAGSTDSGAGAGEGDLQWVRNGDSDRTFRRTDRLRMRPRSSASAPASTAASNSGAREW